MSKLTTRLCSRERLIDRRNPRPKTLNPRGEIEFRKWVVKAEAYQTDFRNQSKIGTFCTRIKISMCSRDSGDPSDIGEKKIFRFGANLRNRDDVGRKLKSIISGRICGLYFSNLN